MQIEHKFSSSEETFSEIDTVAVYFSKKFAPGNCYHFSPFRNASLYFFFGTFKAKFVFAISKKEVTLFGTFDEG